jgi:serine/threonine protein kinase
LGCVIYELACGKPPYAAGSPNELLTKHLRSPIPSAKAANSNVTGSFSNLIRRLLAKQPADRPDSMNEVIRQMEAIQVFDR